MSVLPLVASVEGVPSAVQCPAIGLGDARQEKQPISPSEGYSGLVAELPATLNLMQAEEQDGAFVYGKKSWGFCSAKIATRDRSAAVLDFDGCWPSIA